MRNFPFSTPAKENSTETGVKDCVVVPSKTEPTTVSTASSTRSPLMASTPLSTARGQCQDRGVQSCPSISIGTTPALSLNSEGSEPQIQLPLVISTPPPATGNHESCLRCVFYFNLNFFQFVSSVSSRAKSGQRPRGGRGRESG